MNEIYGIQLLLQSKNPLLFTKTEKMRFANLLQESAHFKLAINSVESKRNIIRLYKNIIMKKYNKNQFIYHKFDPDNHLYVILKGKIACFVPNSQANLLGVASWNNSNQGDKQNQDSNAYKYLNRDDEELLNNDIYFSHVYFSGNNCLYRKIKILTPGEAFGGYTQFHEATFIALEDVTVVVIPHKKYENLFQPEVYRYKFINGSLADLFCQNEQNVRLLIQEEEKLSQIIQQGQNPSNSPISPVRKVNTHILDSVFSSYVQSNNNNNKTNKMKTNRIEFNNLNSNNNYNNEDNDNKMDKLEIDFGRSIEGEMRNNSDEHKQIQMNDSNNNPSNLSILQEEKKQSVELMLKCSELSFHFELFKFDDNKYVYNENDIVDYYYLVSSGKMFLKKSGLTEPIKTYTDGDFLGFEDDNSKRIFSCYVEKDTVVYRILKREFEMNINNNIFSFFKQLQRYKKKQYIEKYKELKESGLIRGIHRKVKSLNTRDIHYKLQLKKQIAQEILDVMQNAKFNQSKQTPSNNQQIPSSSNSSNFYQIQQTNSNRSSSITSTFKNNNIQSKDNYESSRMRSALSLHNPSDKQQNKNHVRFNFDKDMVQSQQPQGLQELNSPQQLQKFQQLSSPLKIQHAQRMVMDQIKKTAQMMEQEKKKSQFNNISRNVDVQFIKFNLMEQKQSQQPTQNSSKKEQIQLDLSPILKRNIFSSAALHRSSSTLNRLNSMDSRCFSPVIKKRNTQNELSMSNNKNNNFIPNNSNNEQLQPSPQSSFSKRGSSEVMLSQLYIPLKSMNNSNNHNISQQDQSSNKSSLSNYSKLNTFSNMYHQKKGILSISPLNVCSQTKRERKSEIEEPEIVKSNQGGPRNHKMLEENLSTETDEMQQNKLENPEWLLETAKRLKDIDIGQIKTDIERQILSIPKQFQDKLWGQNAYKTMSQKFLSNK